MSDEKFSTNFDINYTESISSTLTRTAVQLTNYLQTLLPFSAIEARGCGSRPVPNWVPEWRSATERTGLDAVNRQRVKLVNAWQHFRASDGHPLRFRVVDKSTICVDGVLIGEYTWSQTSMTCRFPDAQSIYHMTSANVDEWEEVWISDFKSLGKGSSSKGRCTSEQIDFRRILIADLNTSHDGKRRCQPSDYQHYKDWSRQPRSPSNASFFRSVAGASSFQRFFFTDNGLYGSGPLDMREGDNIIILAGGNVPYVLRPLAVVDDRETFQLVGDCYVHGIMDGRAVRELDDKIHPMSPQLPSSPLPDNDQDESAGYEYSE